MKNEWLNERLIIKSYTKKIREKNMRCAIDFDENKPLMEQNVSAWGEMQSLKEEPSYKESDIKDEKDKEFFKGYKSALDDVCNVLDNFVMDERISEDNSLDIQQWLAGELCMQLFSILDNQACEEMSEEE